MADNKLLSLTEIFNQRIFRIPDFQRGYSWGVDQLTDFWDDLDNLKEERIHYTGLITVKSIKNTDTFNSEKWKDDLWLFEKGMVAYYLIDGQQRLTTSIIFISCLLEYFAPGEGINFDSREAWDGKFLFQQYGEHYKSFIFGYEKDNPSDEYFKTRILNQKTSTSDKVPEQTLYTANLQFAKDFFSTKFSKLDKEQLQKSFKKIVNKLKFNFYEIDDELDEYVTFETMNNRGKSLSSLELLKNRLIYLSTLLNGDQALKDRLRKDINETWKTIYEYLGKNKDNPLDDDVFLYNHWIMFFKYDRSIADASARYLLHDKFTPKNVLRNNVGFQDIKQYVDSLAESVKSYFFIFNVQHSTFNNNVKEWMQKLNRISLGAFVPLIMAALCRETNEENIFKFLEIIERFQFLIFRLSQRQSNTKNSHFFRLANMLYFAHDYWGSGPTDIFKVIGNISWHIDGSDSENNYIGLFDLSRFLNHINELSQKGEGYYSWNGLRYFLYEYELYLQEKANNNEKVSWVDFNSRKKEDTIEHIYPQTATFQCWIEAFKDVEKKQQKKLLHSLGNLVLLAKAKNSSLQNKCFDHKKSHKDENDDAYGFYNGSYSEIQVASYSRWTAEEIVERGFKMLTFMEKRWGFVASEWEITKEELLSIKTD